MEDYVDMCEVHVSKHIEADMVHLLRENRGKNDEENCQILGEFLKSKYGWLRISVLISSSSLTYEGCHSSAKSGNSRTRGQILKLNFEKKNTVVHYFRPDGEVPDELKKSVIFFLDKASRGNTLRLSHDLQNHCNEILDFFKNGKIPCESIDVLGRTASHYGIDTVHNRHFFNTLQYAIQLPFGMFFSPGQFETVRYFVNLNANFTDGIIAIGAVPDNA